MRLARRLAQVGIVERERGKALQQSLKPGQRLVSREGDLWRWDGYTAAAEAPTTAAQRLAQRNRLTELEVEAKTAPAPAVREPPAPIQTPTSIPRRVRSQQAPVQAPEQYLEAPRDRLEPETRSRVAAPHSQPVRSDLVSPPELRSAARESGQPMADDRRPPRPKPVAQQSERAAPQLGDGLQLFNDPR